MLASVSRYSNTIANTTAILGILVGVYVSCSSGTHLWGFNVTVVFRSFLRNHGMEIPWPSFSSGKQPASASTLQQSKIGISSHGPHLGLPEGYFKIFDTGLLQWCIPKSIVFNTKMIQFWMIWRYPHLRKPPYYHINPYYIIRILLDEIQI